MLRDGERIEFPPSSQSLSGWGGVFNWCKVTEISVNFFGRNPFQGGVGFSTVRSEVAGDAIASSRNPFQGGVGFSTGLWWLPRKQA
mgnify:CR=1 FL=1